MSIRIKNWERHQHFKDRRPPWIKLYRDLLENPDWYYLSGDDAKLLVELWLLASEDETKAGLLPDVRRIAFRLRKTENQVEQQLARLTEWLEIDDISVISDCHHDDVNAIPDRHQPVPAGENAGHAAEPGYGDDGQTQRPDGIPPCPTETKINQQVTENHGQPEHDDITVISSRYQLGPPETENRDREQRQRTETEKKHARTKVRSGMALARPADVSEQVWQDFITQRKHLRAPLTATALEGIKREAEKAGWALERALTECTLRGWRGFKADWVLGKQSGSNSYTRLSEITDFGTIDDL